MKSVLLCLLVTLISMLDVTSLGAQSQQFLGTWYMIYQWEPIKPSNRGAMILTIRSDSTSTMQVDSVTQVVSHWTLDSSSKSMRIRFSESEFSLMLIDSVLVGSMNKEGTKGTCEGTQSRSAVWDTASTQQLARRSQVVPRLSVDYSTVPAKNGRAHIGVVFSNNKTSFNCELLSVSVLEVNKQQYISSNILWPLAAGFIYLFEKATKVEEPSTYIVPIFGQLLGNADLSFPLGTPLINFDIGQCTDFYMFYSPARVMTETRGGLMFNLSSVHVPLQLSLMYAVPWYKGYFERRENHFTIKLGVLMK